MLSTPFYVWHRAFAPATVANVACGFDVLGFALEAPGDTVSLCPTPQREIIIRAIHGSDGNLPTDPLRNTAAVAVRGYLDALGKTDWGAEIEIFKEMPGGSGLGSSAASAVAALKAMNALLDNPMKPIEMLPFAVEAEYAACGSRIADNVAAALLGGIIAVRSYAPLEVLQLPVPPDLWAAVVHPHVVVLTKDARDILPKEVPLATAVRQTGNTVGLVHGLATHDYALIGRSLTDHLAEPYRKALIPAFDDMKAAALAAGALGMSISGSGPAVFALCHGEAIARATVSAMEACLRAVNIPMDSYVSCIART